ncbi:MAG: TerC family protein [Phycisphaerae bacterium]|nr:TerC family protein [Phycisphaerae bacterium]
MCPTLALSLQDLATPQNLIALVTLTAMEIVLGIDNIVFIAIVAGRLPREQREKARIIGLSLALLTRVLFLFTITLIMGLATTPLFSIPFLSEPGPDGNKVASTVSGRDLILLLGGGFLIFKATYEIHNKIEGEEHGPGDRKAAGFWPTIGLILVIDLVFSIDSVVTAVGMAQNLTVMVTAVVISMIVMLAFSGYITRFIDKHPTLKMLALSFLLLIGVVLVADGLGQHISKGYIYFAMAFSLLVEMLNMGASRKKKAAAA